MGLKRLLACICVVALLTCNASAFAMTTTGYKEDTYNAAVRGLESYLESFGNSSAALAGTAGTFKELEGYSQSLYFGYYVAVL